MTLIWFAVLAFCGLTLAEWGPIKTISLDNQEGYFPQMYVDPSTHITHMVWIDNKKEDYRLAYAKMLPDKTMTKPMILDADHRCMTSHMIGEGDGKHLMLAYDGKRTQTDFHGCSGNDYKGCFEIFFIESWDGGDTWTKPEIMKRDNMNDERERKGPRLLYVPENKQIYLTYWRTGPLAYTQRFNNKGEFSREEILPFTLYMGVYQNILYTMYNNNPLFHFLYVNHSYPHEHLMYTNSLDFGKTWKKPVELVYYRHKRPTDIYFRPWAVANHKLMPNSIFVSFIWNNEVFLKWTLDNGKTWSRNLPTKKGKAVAPRLALCPYPSGEKARLYLLFSHISPINGNHFVLGSLNFNTFMYKDEEYPFKGYMFNWAYILGCEMIDRKVIVSAMIESYKDEKSHIFFSQKSDFTSELESL